MASTFPPLSSSTTLDEVKERVQLQRRLQGYIVADPTIGGLASGIWPYGGIPLGLWEQISVELVLITGDIVAEEFGGMVWDQMDQAQSLSLGCRLVEVNAPAFAELFPDTSGRRITISATPGGELRSGRAGKLLIAVPDDECDGQALSVYNAAGAPRPTAEVLYSNDDWWGIPAIFTGLPDSTGRIALFDQLTKLDA